MALAGRILFGRAIRAGQVRRSLYHRWADALRCRGMSRTPSRIVAAAVSPSTARPGRRDPRWRSAAHHGLPVIGVALVVALITIVAYYIYESNRRGAVTLSNDLITAIDRRVGVQMH